MRFLTALAAFLLAFALSACATEQAAEVTEEADADTAGQVVEDGEATAEETESGAAAEEELPTVGDTVSVADWEVKVTKVQTDAGAVIKQANEFNEAAKGQYVLVTYQATYTGAQRTADAWSDLSWSYTGADQQIHNGASAVTPADSQSWPTEARKGGTVKQQVVFDLARKHIKPGILTVEGYTESFDTVYADFEIQ